MMLMSKIIIKNHVFYAESCHIAVQLLHIGVHSLTRITIYSFAPTFLCSLLSAYIFNWCGVSLVQ